LVSTNGSSNDDNDDDNNNNNNNSNNNENSNPCGSASRKTLINLRNDIMDSTTTTTAAGGGEFRLSAAEAVVEKMIDEKWLVESTASKNRRGSMQARVSIAPRTFMELSYLLTNELGMDQELLPQQIYHHISK
jgi:hypothetical protein